MKASKQIKDKIRSSFSQGFSIDQLRQQPEFAGVDGRVFSGVLRDLQKRAAGQSLADQLPSARTAVLETPQTIEPPAPIAPPLSDTPVAPADGMPVSNPQAPVAPTAPISAMPQQVPQVTAQQLLRNMGFVPDNRFTAPAGMYGFASGVKHEFIIYKNGELHDIIPACPKADLLRSLAKGNYMVEVHINGQPVHRETIVIPDKGGNSEALDRLMWDGKDGNEIRKRIFGQTATDQVKDGAAALQTLRDINRDEREALRDEKSSVANVLGDVLKKQFDKPPDKSMDTIVKEITSSTNKQLELMQQAHKDDLEKMREESKLRMQEIERKAEIEGKRQEAAAAQRQAEQDKLFMQMKQMQMDHDTAMQRLETDRQKMTMDMWGKEREFNDRQHKELLEGTTTAIEEVKENLEKDRLHYEEMYKTRTEFETKLNDQKLALSDQGIELKKAEMITNAIAKGVEQVATRLENAAMLQQSKGSAPIQPLTPQQQPTVTVSQQGTVQAPTPTVTSSAPPPDPAQETNPKSAIERAFEKPAFKTLKEEFGIAIKARVGKVADKKLHGAVQFALIADSGEISVGEKRQLTHFIGTRTVEAVVEKIGSSLSEEEKQLFLSEEGHLWYQEFQDAAIGFWNGQYARTKE